MRDNARSGALTEVTFFILLSLYEPRHGYAVMQFVEEQTKGRLILGAGSLYGALNTLEKKGWIQAAKGPGAESGGPVRSPGSPDRKKKEYRITEAGRRIAEQERDRLWQLAHTADRIIGIGEPGEERQ